MLRNFKNRFLGEWLSLFVCCVIQVVRTLSKDFEGGGGRCIGGGSVAFGFFVFTIIIVIVCLHSLGYSIV